MLKRRSVLALLSPLTPTLAIVGCSDPDAKARGAINADWHRRDLVDGLLTPWLAHGALPNGGFRPALDHRWRPLPEAEIGLTGQARLVFSMAVGHEVTQEPRFLDAARRGADFMLDSFTDAQYGGFFHTVSQEGQPKSSIKRAYDHACALLALAQTYKVSGDARYRDAAVQAWQQIDAHFSDASGGLHNECSREFLPTAGTRTQNPLMHMFEALVALHEATGDPQAQAGARRLGDFVSYKLLQGMPESQGSGARIPEWFNENWQALPSKAAGGYIDLGHQFEWSHLLAGGTALSPLYLQVAERVLAYALAEGYDEVDGGCHKRAFPDPGQKPELDKGWWQQAECLHALIVAAHRSGRSDLWRRYEQTLDLIRNELVDTETAGWRAADALPCRGGSCRDLQPEPYHMARLHYTALKLAGALPPPASAASAASATSVGSDASR